MPLYADTLRGGGIYSTNQTAEGREGSNGLELQGGLRLE
jgi:hypothetical protein